MLPTLQSDGGARILPGLTSKTRGEVPPAADTFVSLFPAIYLSEMTHCPSFLPSPPTPPAPPSILPGLIKVKSLPSSKEAHLHPAGKQPVTARSKGLLIQSGGSSVRPYHHRHGHLWEPHHRASPSCWLRLVGTESQKEVCITTSRRGSRLIGRDSQRTGKGLNNSSRATTAALGTAHKHTGNAT